MLVGWRLLCSPTHHTIPLTIPLSIPLTNHTLTSVTTLTPTQHAQSLHLHSHKCGFHSSQTLHTPKSKSSRKHQTSKTNTQNSNPSQANPTSVTTLPLGSVSTLTSSQFTSTFSMPKPSLQRSPAVEKIESVVDYMTSTSISNNLNTNTETNNTATTTTQITTTHTTTTQTTSTVTTSTSVPPANEAQHSTLFIERTLVSPYKTPQAPSTLPKGPKFTILQYNILITQIDVEPKYYYCPEYAQKWDYRGPNIVKELRGYNADIICLQEVDKFDFLDTSLSQDGYVGIYEPRPYKHLDGLAMFYKKDKFKLIKSYIVNYNKIHIPARDPAAHYLENRFGFINRGKSKYETNNIALVCELETNEPVPRRLFVATTHIYWNPRMPELKVLQSYTLLKELEKIFKVEEKGKSVPPLVITGDFNAMPQSGMYQLYATQNLPSTHADIQSLILKDLSHSLPICSAYAGLGEPLTNITKGFSATLDYIWYTNTQLSLGKVLSPITHTSELPNLQFSSDHTAIMCELDFIE